MKRYIAMFYEVEFINLTHFKPLISFYTPWKHQKTVIFFLKFSGSTERDKQ